MSPIRELRRIGGAWLPLHGGRESDGSGQDDFILGVTKPSAANTGLNVEGINPNSLTVVSGPQTHSTNDAVYENIRFTGRIVVTGKRIKYRNCWFGPSYTVASGGTGLVNCNNSTVEDVIFENCLFRLSSFAQTYADAVSNCIFGHNYTLYRCDMSGTTDIVGVYSGAGLDVPARNVNILGCYLHNMAYYSPEPRHTDNQTHNDIVQVHGGVRDFVMRGCTAEAYIDPDVGDAMVVPYQIDGKHGGGNFYYPSLAWMAVFMLSPANMIAGVQNFIIDQNWLGGGRVVINWSRDDGINVQITNNRWTRGSSLGDDATILMRPGQLATITGNHYEDTLEAWNGRRNG